MTLQGHNNMLKLYIGCGPSPVHPQHLEILGNPSEWTFVDKYVQEPHIKNWDGRFLTEVQDGTVDEIYSSHTLEHFEHGMIPEILKTWHKKLKPGGVLTINVPDIMWALRRLKHLENGGMLSGYYTGYNGDHGILSIIFGSQSHEGEYHKGAFTHNYLEWLLTNAGFQGIDINDTEDSHDMGILLAVCRKLQ